MTLNAISAVLGVVGALVYILFIAFKIGEVPLWVIVIGTIILMLYGFVQEFREERANRAALERRNGGR